MDQLRNTTAFGAVAPHLSGIRGPVRVLYVASGSHLAPLALLENDPSARAYTFVFTERDPRVGDPIGETLRWLQEKGLLGDLRASADTDRGNGRRWSFRWSRHPVEIVLALSGGAEGRESSLFTPDLLRRADLVFSHDWSGEPLPNLALLAAFLDAAAQLPSAAVPPLFMEDLGAHPYPIDLSFFDPLARVPGPYGHRALRPVDGVESHGKAETGPPVFGGAVLLGFREPWWRRLSSETRRRALDFLLFRDFDEGRQNVLEGGADPLLAPAVLDGLLGYGCRTLSGEDLRLFPGAKAEMVKAAAEAARASGPALRRRWECSLLRYRALLEIEASGSEPAELNPASRFRRRPAGSEWGGDAAAMYHEAERRSAAFPRELEGRVRRARELLPLLRSQREVRCGNSGNLSGEQDWTALYWAVGHRLDENVGGPVSSVAKSGRGG